MEIPPPPDSEDEESEAEEEEIPAEKTEVSQEMENQEGTTSDNKDTQIYTEKSSEGMIMGGIKRHHHSDTLDSDKEKATQIVET